MPRVSLLLLTFCTSIFWSAPGTVTAEEPVVKTSLGDIQGRLIKVPDNNVEHSVFEFIGIPFAKAPIGDLRFRKPEPIEPWTGTYEATKWSGICLQDKEAVRFYDMPPGTELSEDCLYLNIWSPELKTQDQNPKKTVMVFIYGGAFKSGSASRPVYHGAKLSTVGDVVVVTLNYRIGVLGFLNLGVEAAPGNQAFWDQSMALRWIQEHIENFGGDPNQITIFGESAGSMSVGAQLISPMSRGLFRRAIMQSGSPFNKGLLSSPQIAQTTAINYAIKEGCYDQKGDIKNETVIMQIINCLRQIEATIFTETQEGFYENLNNSRFVPTYGDQFLPHQETGELAVYHTPVELMIGVNNNEGSIFMTSYLRDLPNDANDFTVADAKLVGKRLMGLTDEDLVQQALRFYFEDIPENLSPDELKQITANVFGDPAIVCPSMYFAEYFSQKHPVYFFHFNHRHSNSQLEQWMGMVHAEELQYVFLNPMSPDVINTEAEIIFGREVVEMWTKFAKTGNPNILGRESWPQYSDIYPVYMDLKPNNYTLGIGPRLRACNFWRCHLYHLQ